ncbi:hypothetical protein HPP92_003016 [Vanilla planifolia]|uniref:Uncharacterized protein n=1 Tax=Vanilla planifolia TaxID=51239 RepID=A0A835VJH2_VANPL|nr:hypothetical protein HPP92_003016 [Vanilla planifolia]
MTGLLIAIFKFDIRFKKEEAEVLGHSRPQQKIKGHSRRYKVTAEGRRRGGRPRQATTEETKRTARTTIRKVKDLEEIWW